MSAFRRPVHISRKHSSAGDTTVQLLNLNILSYNQGPGFAALLKIAFITAFAYVVYKFVNGECPIQKKLNS
jgi:hypothetical protein